MSRDVYQEAQNFATSQSRLASLGANADAPVRYFAARVGEER